MKETVEFVDGFRKAMKRALLAVAEAYSRIPAPIREELMWAARERRSIEKYQALHEAERQSGLTYVRELGAQARRGLGLPEEER